MSTTVYLLQLIGPAITTLGLVASGLGIVFSRLGISFGEHFWIRLDQLKRTTYFWSFLGWHVRQYLQVAVVFIWILIGASVLAFGVWPDELFHAAVANAKLPSEVRLPAYFLLSKELLLGGPIVLAAWGLSLILFDWLNSRVFNRTAEIVISLVEPLITYVLGIAGFAAVLFTAWQVHWTTATAILPAIANDIASHYNTAHFSQVAAFGIVTMAVYPIPLVLICAGIYFALRFVSDYEEETLASVVIIACALAFALWPEKLLHMALAGHVLSGGVSIPSFSTTQRGLLLGVPIAVGTWLLLMRVVSALIFDNEHLERFQIIGAIFVVALGATAAALVLASLWQASWTTAFKIVPAVANQILRQPSSVELPQIGALMVVSMAVYPIPLILAWRTTDAFLNFIAAQLEIENVFSLYYLQERLERVIWFLLLVLPGAIASIFWTLLMLVFGNYVQHESVQVTLQLLAANALFDGLTVFVAVSILGWAAYQYDVRLGLQRYDAARSRLLEAERIADTDSNRADYKMYRVRSARTTIRFALRDLLRLARVKDDTNLPAGAEALEVPSARLTEDERAELDKKAVDWAISNEAGWRRVIERVIDRSWWRVFPAFLSTLVAAAFLSCAALYFGVWGTPTELSFAKVAWTFIGGFDGKNFTELGPLFWVTHSTFLPTIFLWLVIGVTFVTAYVIAPVGNFVARIGRAAASDLKTGLMKYGAVLVVAGGSIDQVMKLFIGVVFPGK